MKVTGAIVRIFFTLCIVFGAGSAVAGPLRCSYGNQDSTCTTPISAGWQPQPQCSTGPGWTTVGGSTWIGSQWTAPQCNYQAPPSCPTGFNQTSAPWWNGSSWVGLGCASPPSVPTNPVAACTAAVPPGYSSSASWKQVSGGIVWDALAQQAGISGYSSEWELFPAFGPAYSSACGSGNEYDGMCYARSDNSVAGIIMSESLNFSNGQCNH